MLHSDFARKRYDFFGERERLVEHDGDWTSAVALLSLHSERAYTEKQNGLDEEKTWADGTYVNPPFSNTELWIERALKEKKAGNRSYVLLPVRPDTKYQSKLIQGAMHVLLLADRVSFGKPGKRKGATGRMPILIAGLGISTNDLVEAGLDGIVVRYEAPDDWADEAAKRSAEDEMWADGSLKATPFTLEELADAESAGREHAMERESRLAQGRADVEAARSTEGK